MDSEAGSGRSPWRLTFMSWAAAESHSRASQASCPPGGSTWHM